MNYRVSCFRIEYDQAELGLEGGNINIDVQQYELVVGAEEDCRLGVFPKDMQYIRRNLFDVLND